MKNDYDDLTQQQLIEKLRQALTENSMLKITNELLVSESESEFPFTDLEAKNKQLRDVITNLRRENRLLSNSQAENLQLITALQNELISKSQQPKPKESSSEERGLKQENSALTQELKEKDIVIEKLKKKLDVQIAEIAEIAEMKHEHFKLILTLTTRVKELTSSLQRLSSENTSLKQVNIDLTDELKSASSPTSPSSPIVHETTLSLADELAPHLNADDLTRRNEQLTETNKKLLKQLTENNPQLTQLKALIDEIYNSYKDKGSKDKEKLLKDLNDKVQNETLNADGIKHAFVLLTNICLQKQTDYGLGLFSNTTTSGQKLKELINNRAYQELKNLVKPISIGQNVIIRYRDLREIANQSNQNKLDNSPWKAKVKQNKFVSFKKQIEELKSPPETISDDPSLSPK